MIRRLILVSAALLIAGFPSSGLSAPKHQSKSGPQAAAPKAPKRRVVNTYWGVRVPDDYQYMERASDPATSKWARAQNRATRAWLDGHPERKAILGRVAALTHSDSPDYYSGTFRSGRYFFRKEQPPQEQPSLVMLSSVQDRSTERTIVDPNRIDPTGGTSIDFFAPSLDGKKVAVSLSKGGSEEGTLYFYDSDSGRRLDDVIPRVNGGTAGGSAAWNADGSGVYYTRYPNVGERPKADLSFYQQIYFHRLGAPVEQDTYVLGKEFPKIAEIELTTSPDGRSVLADVSNGDGGEHAYWLLGATGGWTQITRFEDDAVQGVLGMDGTLYLLSRANASRRKILKLAPGSKSLAEARVVVPETENTIEGITATASRLYVREMIGGPTRVRVYDLSGKALGLVGLPEPAIIGQPVRTTGDEVILRCQSYLRPPAYYRYGPGDSDLVPTALAQTSPADFSDCEVRRVFASAEDGTKLPINVIARKGTKLDGHAPLLLYGYGSYGLSEEPYFQPEIKAWVEQGGIYADASVRGGGEFGEEWHDAARLGTKKVSMDDFAACARYLVQQGYTKKERLAIQGGSAGGLLVYGTLVHHPDVMQAAVANVGYGDVLRTELSPNGEFNTTEFGTVKDSTQFRGMAAYSPYHHVKRGVAYPSVLGTTGVNDPRVPSWETYKMIAQLQGSGSPGKVLMRVSYDTGHGGGTARSERDRETADALVFLFDRLGVKYRPVEEEKKPGKARPSL
jgi:prolyl oligopeptidase